MENVIEVDVKTKTDIPEKLTKQIKDLDKIPQLEKVLDFLLNKVDLHPVSADRFEKDPEKLFTITIFDDMVPLIEKIENNSVSLIKICDGKITEGDTSRKEEKFVIKKEDFEKISEEQRPDFMKVVRGGDVGRFIVKWKGDYVKTIAKFVPTPRLLIKDIGKRLTVAYDPGELRCLRTIYCAYPKDPQFDIHYILAVLNSELMHFYYLAYFYTSQMSPREGNFRFRKQFVKRLPVKKIDPRKQEKLLATAKNIIENRAKLVLLAEKIFPDDYLKEKDLISCETLLTDPRIKRISLNKNSYKIDEKNLRGDSSRDMQNVETFRISLMNGEFVDFKSANALYFIWEVLKTKKEITKRELLRIKMPLDGTIDGILKQLNRDKENMKDLEKKVQDSLDLVDRLVHECYNISYAERKFIRNYVDKFS